MKDFLGSFLMRWRIRAVLPYLHGDVVDVGCGLNQLIRAYRAENPDKKGLGVDVYPWEGVDVTIDNAARLPFDNSSCDTVCCIAALNHIPNREEFLREAHRILRPDGHFVMTMIPPALSRVWHFLRSPWDADQHERGMSAGEVYGLGREKVISLARNAGFCLKRTQSFMFSVNTVFVFTPSKTS